VRAYRAGRSVSKHKEGHFDHTEPHQAGAKDADIFRMTRIVPWLVAASLVLSVAPIAADEAQDDPTGLPAITIYNDGGWAPLGRHAITLSGPGATTSGTATATFKSKLDGPKTYVIIAGTTSELTMNDPKPRFRILSDRNGAMAIQLAEFEADETQRSTTIERVRKGVLFTKAVDLEVMKVGEGVWELRPTKSLQPGEYALTTTDTDPVADFTIVAKGY